jgi:hypothetical protein
MNIFAPIGKLTHYLDPGTGSMVLQVVLAALLSVGVLLKVFWRKIRGWFNPLKPRSAMKSTRPKLQKLNLPNSVLNTT